MKSFIIAFLFLILSSCTTIKYMEPESNLEQVDYSIVWSKFHYSNIQNNKKPIMLFVCNDSKESLQMERALSNEEIISYLNKHFIAIRLDSRESGAMDMFLEIKDVPALLFIGPTDKGPGFTIEIQGPVSQKVTLSILEKIVARSNGEKL